MPIDLLNKCTRSYIYKCQSKFRKLSCCLVCQSTTHNQCSIRWVHVLFVLIIYWNLDSLVCSLMAFNIWILRHIFYMTKENYQKLGVHGILRVAIWTHITFWTLTYCLLLNIMPDKACIVRQYYGMFTFCNWRKNHNLRSSSSNLTVMSQNVKAVLWVFT
jgi:hypothetical protein